MNIYAIKSSRVFGAETENNIFIKHLLYENGEINLYYAKMASFLVSSLKDKRLNEQP